VDDAATTINAVAVTSRPAAFDRFDFLALDALLDVEERAIRDTVRRFVRERVTPGDR
jgi:glutaryl-CoA dehydrogenase